MDPTSTPNPLRRPSLDDVAQAAGVGKSTAARALKGDKHVARKTSKVVLEAAQKLGYQPDPVLSSLARERWRTRENFSGTTVALVHYPREGEVSRVEYESVGIHYAAHARGYRVETVDAAEFADSQRLAQVLEARNYRGILFGPMHCPPDWLNLDWDAFALVAYGTGTIHPYVDCVALDHLNMTRHALRRAREAGRARTGLVLIDPPDAGSRDAMRAAHGLEQDPAAGSIPPHEGRTNDPDAFYAWFHEHQPDCIVANNLLPYQWLSGVGLSMPGDIGFATLELLPDSPFSITGFGYGGDKLGKRAMALLDHALCTNTRGLPELPACVTLVPPWNPGETLAQVSA